ncbi:MAG: flagellar hook-basal body complex protein FliE [Planctomycetes bacterium]|nr:flagellar hook-basal body complex protein FliE [Planctomycetota bacterium]
MIHASRRNRRRRRVLARRLRARLDRVVQDASGAKFTQLLEGLVQDANTAQKHSEALVQGLARGEPVDSHQVITALTEADLSFRTLLEVRTRLIEAYQEIQRMQV